MNRSNPSNPNSSWDEESSRRQWSSGSQREGREGGRGYGSDQVYGQGNPSNQRGSETREDYRGPYRERHGEARDSGQSSASRPGAWNEDRWNEYSDDEPRWSGGGYRESYQQNQGNRGRQGGDPRHEYGRGFESRHPRFGESRLASSGGRDNYSLPDYYGTSYEGQDLARLRAGHRPDDESRRSADNRHGNTPAHGPRYGNTYGPSERHFGTSDAFSAARTSPYFGKGPKGYSRSDDRIRDDVCERLTYDPDVDASDVTVTVSQGEVTLAGEVEDRRSKRRAEDLIEDVPGVRDVHNQLRSRRGFFGSMVAEVTGKEQEESNVGKGPHTANAPSSASSGTTGTVRNGGSEYR